MAEGGMLWHYNIVYCSSHNIFVPVLGVYMEAIGYARYAEHLEHRAYRVLHYSTTACECIVILNTKATICSKHTIYT